MAAGNDLGRPSGARKNKQGSGGVHRQHIPKKAGPVKVRARGKPLASPQLQLVVPAGRKVPAFRADFVPVGCANGVATQVSCADFVPVGCAQPLTTSHQQGQHSMPGILPWRTSGPSGTSSPRPGGTLPCSEPDDNSSSSRRPFRSGLTGKPLSVIRTPRSHHATRGACC